jgi:long-chain acyl-CoA synthetase
VSNQATFAEAFDGLSARQAGRVAVRDGGRDLSYGQLFGWSERITRALGSVVRAPGQRVALMMPNSAAFAAAFFAVARAGAVVAPVNPGSGSHDLTSHLSDLDAVALLADPATLARTATTIERLTLVPATFEVSEEYGARPVRPGTTVGEALPTTGGLPLLQLYTSGSTGKPKRVVRTHAQLRAELDCLRQTFAVTEADRFLGVAPFFHVNGLVRTMLNCLYSGATLLPVAEFRRREVTTLLTTERVTFLGGVPQIFAIIGQTPLRGHVDLSALRIVFSSSAPLTPADAARFRGQYGVVIRQLYGSSETGTISFNRSSDPEATQESVGQPLDGVRVEVLDDQDRVLPPGHEGELAIASPFAVTGYHGNPEATAESFRGGFYRSGDIGIMSLDGTLRLTGRKKLMINRGGFKVNPYEVEEVIKMHPKVAEVAVFGSPSASGDDLVCCVVVPSAPCTAEDILLHCKARIADFKIPAHIEFRVALPTSAAGKILRGQLAIRRADA